MDVKLAKRPLSLGGVLWSTANRWVIGTKGRVFILTPECANASGRRERREVSAAIEPANSIEAVCLLEPLSEQYAYDNALGVLASDSSLRIFAPLGNPDTDNWSQVGSYKSETVASQMCAISCTVSSAAVAACGFMNGWVEVVGLKPLEDDSENMAIGTVLSIEAGRSAVCHMAWINGGDSRGLLLLMCTVDGGAALWRVGSDLKQASLLTTIGGQDWRSFTAHSVSGGCLVLAKMGSVAIVDIVTEGEPKVEYVPLAVSQTIVSCVIDESRERIYVGAADSVVFILAKQNGRWAGMPEEERVLRDGMRKTVVKSFTTKFRINRLLLRGLYLSPNGRYLAFDVDDQVDWDVASDGAFITRLHFHQFADWTPELLKRSVIKLADGKYQGELRYALWDLLDGCTAEDVAAMVEALQQINVASGSVQQRQRLAILNYIASTPKANMELLHYAL
ncbi:hypothetical protein LPJ60_004076 [Coemansia sp. RSA 2675]|nr:hypothetical protein LPJ60_004076 [Coemansia sp. RSA 2675]